MVEELTGNIGKQTETWFQESLESERDLRQRMDLRFRFALGDQWDAADITKLNEEGRPHVTINKIRPVLKIITGYQRQNQMDIKALPVEASDFPITDVLNQLLKAIMKPSGTMTLSLKFADGLICGKGWGYAYLDTNRNPYDLIGDIVYKHISPFHVFPDPYSLEPDLSDARYVIRYLKYHPTELKRLYPKADLGISVQAAITETTAEVPMRYKGYQSDPYGKALMDNAGEASTKDDRLAVLECWYRKYEQEKFIYNRETGEFFPSRLLDDQLDALVGQVPALTVIKRIIPKVYVAAVLNGIELEDHESPIEGNIYPLVPFYCDFTPSARSHELRFQGVVESLIDPQKEINKRRAQMLHIVNTAANSGWIIERGALQDKRILEQFGSKPGIVIEVEAGRKIEKIEPSNVPRAYTDLELMSSGNIKEISGINADMTGEYEKTASGIAIQSRQKQGITSIQDVFDNFNYAKQRVGLLLLKAIQSFYTPQKLMRIIGPNHQIQQKYKVPMEAIVAALSTKDLSQYDVAIDEGLASPTYRMARFQQLLQLAQLMPGIIPPAILIEASDIDGKDELLAQLGDQEGQGVGQEPPNGGAQNPALNQAIQQNAEAIGAGAM